MLDSCRADKIGAYGFSGPTTPRLDALAADPDAILFRWHFAQAPHTKASTASLFTGTYPFQHGLIVEDLLSEVELRSGRYREKLLAPELPTLAESFHAGGYRTMAAVRIGHLSTESGFGRGFDRFAPSGPETSDGRALESALEFLAEDAGPAFAYVHLRACHNPYPAAGRDPGYWALAGERFDEEALKESGIDPGIVEFKLRVRSGEIRPSPEQVRYVHAVYESRLRRVDERLVGAVSAGLRARKLYDRTLLLLSADHGEELLDHGSYAHGHAVWNEVVRVPLIVKLPLGGRSPALGNRVDHVSQAIDLMPSLLRFAGIEPPRTCNASDLFRSGASGDAAFTQAPGSWAMVSLPWKLVVHEPGRAELYDLSIDAGELRDAAGAHPDRVRRLVRRGQALRVALARYGESAGAGSDLSAEQIEELRSLGYIR